MIVTGRWQEIVALNQQTLGVQLQFVRNDWIPQTSSIWANWRIRYDDGSYSPESWLYLTNLWNVGFARSGRQTINLYQEGKALNSFARRSFEIKGYTRRHSLVKYAPSTWETSYDQLKLDVDYFECTASPVYDLPDLLG